MAYTVTVYFDNMVDEVQSFEKEGDAAKCHVQLKNRYRGQRLYRVEIEKVRETS